MLRLYTYFRSSAAYRVRIALNLKALSYEALPVHLLRGGGEQHHEGYVARNPAHLVPLLEEDAFALTQSLAIIEYLEQRHPDPPLLPAEERGRAQVRAFALSIACDIHPLCNLRVLQYLKEIGIDPAQRREWSRHWIGGGLAALERTLASGGAGGRCCFGDLPTLADCCLIPQVFNALRLECPLTEFPTVERIYRHCMTLQAFQRAAPEVQSDAE